MFLLVQRFGENRQYRFNARKYEFLDDAVWAARESAADYLIEKATYGVAPAEIVKYRIGEREMG